VLRPYILILRTNYPRIRSSLPLLSLRLVELAQVQAFHYSNNSSKVISCMLCCTCLLSLSSLLSLFSPVSSLLSLLSLSSLSPLFLSSSLSPVFHPSPLCGRRRWQIFAVLVAGIDPPPIAMITFKTVKVNVLIATE